MSYFSAEIIRWFDTNVKDIGICRKQYKVTNGFIPSMDTEGGVSRLFTLIMDLIVLLIIIIKIGRIELKYEYLIPFYKRILYVYGVVVLISCGFQLTKYVANDDEGKSGLHDAEKPWYIVSLRVAADGINSAVQIFMLGIIFQDQVRYTARIFVIAIIMFSFVCWLEVWQQHYYIEKNLKMYSILNLIENIVPYIIFILVFIYTIFIGKCYPQQPRKRIIFWYSLTMIFILTWSIIAYSLLSADIDGYCFDSYKQYLLRFGFPLLLWWTIMQDNKIWYEYIEFLLHGNKDNQSTAISIWSGLNIERNDHSLNESLIHQTTVDFIGDKCNIYNFYEIQKGLGRIIGTGSSGEIRICTLENGDTVVVKQLCYQGNTKYNKTWRTKEIMQEMINYVKEALIVSEIQHVNIVEFKGISYYFPRVGKNAFYLIYESCNAKNVRKFLNLDSKSNDAHICQDFQIRIKLLFDAANGIRKLHEQNIAHRDLKPDNILVHCDDEKLNQYTAKICDFGDVIHLHHRSKILLNDQKLEQNMGRTSMSVDNEMVIITRMQGTPAYHPPEYQGADKEILTTQPNLLAADVWAFGKIMWEVGLTCRLGQVRESGVVEEMPKFEHEKDKFNNDEICFAQLVGLITDCWKSNPILRPTFEDIVENLTAIQPAVSKRDLVNGYFNETDDDFSYKLPSKLIVLIAKFLGAIKYY